MTLSGPFNLVQGGTGIAFRQPIFLPRGVRLLFGLLCLFNRIPVFLECYADRLVSLYEHVGFEVFRVFEDPAFDVKQVCMVRHPKGGKVS